MVCSNGRVFAQAGDCFRFDLDAGESGHAVKQHGDRGAVSHGCVIAFECWWRNRGTIEVRRDDEYGFGAGSRGLFDFLDRRSRALLSRTGDESHRARRLRPRCFEHRKIFAIVEMYALAGRAEQHVTRDSLAGPRVEIAFERAQIHELVAVKRRDHGKQDAVQFRSQAQGPLIIRQGARLRRRLRTGSERKDATRSCPSHHRAAG